jgi:hypothetical protein
MSGKKKSSTKKSSGSGSRRSSSSSNHSNRVSQGETARPEAESGDFNVNTATTPDSGGVDMGVDTGIDTDESGSTGELSNRDRDDVGPI